MEGNGVGDWDGTVVKYRVRDGRDSLVRGGWDRFDDVVVVV